MEDERRYSDILIDMTINEIADILETAGRGLVKTNHEGGEAQIGSARAIRRKVAEIKANVLEKLA